MNQSQPQHQNIVLVGFMGCGKSTVGRELNQRLGFPLLDTDTEIESLAAKPITRIFEEDGETAFRDMESAILREIHDTQSQNRIISTGGGIIGRQENRDLLRKLGYVVWLQAPVSTILERTLRNNTRPLLQTSDPAERISALLEERSPLYQETAHLALDTSGLDCAEVATGILECARYHFSTRE